MTDTRKIALVTDSPVSVFGDYLDESRTHDPVQRTYGVLGHHDYQAILDYYPLNPLKHAWPFLDDHIPDVVFYLYDDRFFDGDEPRARLSAELVRKLIQRSDVIAGTFEDTDEVCFLYWNQDHVVINSDPHSWSSPDGEALRDALDKAGITYDTKNLGHYFMDLH
jgi:hypothetical protein